MSNIAIIIAGGSGSRMGQDIRFSIQQIRLEQ